ncbi:MAG: hypothetical protein U0324_15205 [Polyangiales bacterium]
MKLPRALLACAALTAACAARPPRPAPPPSVSPRSPVHFVLDADSAARLTPEARDLVLGVLDDLCRRDLAAAYARFDARPAAEELEALGGDRARFVGEQLTLQPLADSYLGVAEGDEVARAARVDYGWVLGRVERAVVIDVRPWDRQGSFVARGVLTLAGGLHCRFGLFFEMRNGFPALVVARG